MRDWKPFVRERLSLAGLATEREERIVAELAEQLEDFYRDARARGLSEDDAEAFARRQVQDWGRFQSDIRRAQRSQRRSFIEQWAERTESQYPHKGGWRMIWSDLLQDLSYAARLLRRSPGFTAVAVLTLALGIGGSTAIFSVVEGILMQPLPYEEPDRLVMVWGHHPQIGREAASYPDFVDWRERNNVFDNMVAIARQSLNLTGIGRPERIVGARATSGLFPLMGAKPILGRAFLPEDDRPGAERVTILSHGFWLRRLGADRNIIGTKMVFDGNPYTVVGIAPAEFDFPGDVEAWAPLALDVNQTGRRSDFLRVAARLKRGVSLEQAQAEMDDIMQRLEQEYPQSNAGWDAQLIPLHEQVVGNVRPALLVLLAAVGFVLLIACANVANLLLARASSREKETPLRAALGATRSRLARQWLTESLLLGCLGGAVGLMIAHWGLRALLRAAPETIPRLDNVGVDTTVLGFAVLVSMFTAVGTGLIPAWRLSRSDLHQSLKEGGRGTAGEGHRITRRLLVVAEVALAMILLVGAGLTIRSYAGLLNSDPGFRPENLLTMRILLPSSKYPERPQIASLFQQLKERVQALPAVESVTLAGTLPLSGGGPWLSLGFEGRPAAPAGEVVDANIRFVDDDYFRTLGIRLLQGRGLQERDSVETPFVVVINETLRRQYFPDEDPLGRRIAFDGTDGQPTWREIVGVVADVAHEGLDRGEVRGIYVPYPQRPTPAMTLVVRTASEPSRLVGAVREQVQALDPDQPVYQVRTMEEFQAATLSQPRFQTLLLGLFSILALVLAAIGVYGVLAYSVSRRTYEVGVRIALGARSRDVLRMVVGEALALVGIGAALGLAVSMGLTRFLASMLVNVSATDPLTLAGVSLLLLAVAVAAAWLPAWRATKVHPTVALRCE